MSDCIAQEFKTLWWTLMEKNMKNNMVSLTESVWGIVEIKTTL